MVKEGKIPRLEPQVAECLVGTILGSPPGGCVLAEEKECELCCSLCVIEGFGISADGLLKWTEIKLNYKTSSVNLLVMESPTGIPQLDNICTTAPVHHSKQQNFDRTGYLGPSSVLQVKFPYLEALIHFSGGRQTIYDTHILVNW